MTEIKQLTAELYTWLGLEVATRSKEAKLLERIDLAAEALEAENDKLRAQIDTMTRVAEMTDIHIWHVEGEDQFTGSLAQWLRSWNTTADLLT